MDSNNVVVPPGVGINGYVIHAWWFCLYSISHRVCYRWPSTGGTVYIPIRLPPSNHQSITFITI